MSIDDFDFDYQMIYVERNRYLDSYIGTWHPRLIRVIRLMIDNESHNHNHNNCLKVLILLRGVLNVICDREIDLISSDYSGPK
jgi:hypothetical protein